MMPRLFLLVCMLNAVLLSSVGAFRLVAKKDKCKMKFHPSADIACDFCMKNAQTSGPPDCTCQVGDCSEEMAEASKDCGANKEGKPNGPYYCAVCAPLSIPTRESEMYPDGKITTSDFAKEGKWRDVRPCR